MDVGRAFTYFTSDPQWIQKFAIAGAIVLVQLFIQFPFAFLPFGGLPGGLISLIAGFFLMGYLVELTRRVYEGVDIPLPEWDNAGEYFIRGAIVSAGVFIWMLPFIALVLCLGVLGAVAAGADAESGAFALMGLSLCLFLPFIILFLAFIYPLIVARYAVEGRFGAMFEFGEIVAEIRRAPVPLLITGLVIIAATLIAAAGVLACLVGALFTVPYAYVIQGHMFGQVYRQARGVPDTTVTQAF